jgi:UDPglucose 6-dehydrogenase
VELCRWLAFVGASVSAHDPAVSMLPADLAGVIELFPSPLHALADADALVVCTAWPDYLQVPVADLLGALSTGLVVDPAGVLRGALAGHPDARYVRVGSPIEVFV